MEEMVSKLAANPDVLGLIEYGNARKEDDHIPGDYDLVVILEEKDADVESLHFYVSGVPADLNVRTLDEIRSLRRAEGFDSVLLDGRISHDPDGQVSIAIRELRDRHAATPAEAPSQQSFAFERHGTKHVFDKIRGRLETMPTLCAHLLHQNVYWLVRHYFLFRGLDYKGEKAALGHIGRHEPELFQRIEAFYGTTDLAEQTELCRHIAEAVLEPVGGMWREDELLTFGDQEKGKDTFRRLFGRDFSGA